MKNLTKLAAALSLCAMAVPMSASAADVFLFDLNEESSFATDFTVLDKNADGTTWKWGKYTTGSVPYYYAECYKYNTANDDYLTTSKAYHLVPGVAYRMSYTSSLGSSGTPTGSLDVLMGTSADVTAMSKLSSQTSFSYKNRYSGEKFDETAVMFEVETEGDYYFSLHLTTSLGMYVDDWHLANVGSPNTPKAVTGLTVTADAARDTKATVAFTLPSQTVTGTTLTSLSKAEISRGGSVVNTLESLTPGENVSWLDENAGEGTVTYSVVVYNGEYVSDAVSASAFVGPETPNPVTGLTLSREAGVNKLSWTAPTKGLHNVVLDASMLKYRVSRIVGENVTVVGEAVSGTSYDDEFDPDTRTKVSYSVVAMLGNCESTAVTSSSITAGSISLPFADSFAKATISDIWETVIVNGTKNWEAKASCTYPTSQPQDGDGGFVYYNSYNASRTYSARLITPEFKSSSATNPVFEFYMSHGSSGDDAVYVDVQKDGGEWTTVSSAFTVKSTTTGWVKHTVSIKEAIDGSKTFKVALRSYSAYGQNIAIDNIQVYNLLDHDLKAGSVSGSATVVAGNKGSFKFEVQNIGGNAVTADDYTIEVTLDGNKIGELAGVEIASAASATLTFEHLFTAEEASESAHNISGKVVYANDQNPDNNTFASASTLVSTVNKAVVKDLAGVMQATGEIELTWSSPINLDGYTETNINEGWESYETSFAGPFGDWTTVDLDKTTGTSYWFTSQPADFAIYNPGTSTSAPAAHGGSKFVVSSGYLNGTSATQVDDWLISPALNTFDGATFDVSFWYIQNNSSKMQGEVLYSTTDTATDSFTKVGDFSNTNAKSWRQYTCEVPGTAKYIALRNVSTYTYGAVLGFDDIVIKSVVDKVLGYNVYEEGVGRLNSEMLTEPTFTVPAATHSELAMRREEEASTRLFSVTTVYEGGEGAKSEFAVVSSSATGVSSIVVSDAVRVIGNEVSVPCAADVYSIDGRLVCRCAEAANVQLRAGVYLVRTAFGTAKVVVR